MTGEVLVLPDHLSGAIIDVHTHFFPEKLFASLWGYFERRSWAISYQDTADGLSRILRDLGVARFTTFNYAHKAGMAADLNEWTLEFCRKHPAAIPFATVFPGDEGNIEMLDSLFDQGFAGIKLQPLVSDFYACDERMREVYRFLVERGKVLAIHAGTAPVANRYVGAEYFEPVMEWFPEMKVLVAHMGAYEYDRFFELARRFPNLYLDTSVNLIDPAVMEDQFRRGRFPAPRIPTDFDQSVILELQDRVLFGSDFPNIPYTYQDCVDGILALGFGREFERKVFFENARMLFD